jgi:thiamine biosynthesis lipoprotein
VLRGAAQGTTYHIKFVAPETTDVQHLQADVEKVLAEIDQQMSTYRPDSEISRFNRAPAGTWFAVPPAIALVVATSRVISEKTGGAQDVTVGPLVRLWHFGPPENGSDPRAVTLKPPADSRIQQARQRTGYKNLDVRRNPPALRKQLEGLEVDLSSIASGYTVDQLASLLSQRGIKNYMVELGGELRAAGTRADDSPWRIAIERPLAQKRDIETSLSLTNAAMATAGGSRHFFVFAGKRYSHIIDPATGRPVEHALSSVTVAADTCLEADGWDTPLVVLGPERGRACAERNGIAALFIVHTDNGDEMRTTSAWQKRFAAK